MHNQITPEAKRRILVIDDEPTFSRMLGRQLEQLGFEVTTSSKVDPAEFADLRDSDVIFVDMLMPEVDGIQALETLARRHVKASVVLMSGVHGEILATAETMAKRSGLRVLGVLRKPFRTPDLRELLENSQDDKPKTVSQPVSSDINIEDILAGLERREFDVFLQPIVDLATGELAAYEALARWRSEKFALVVPGRFISLAARHGILPRVSFQVLDRALSYTARLRSKGIVPKVAVNFGAEDMLDSGLPEKLAQALAVHDLPPESLIVELTESSAVTNEIMMLGILARLRLKGIELAIDDFGTSYSGLERLSTVPFTWLKIDKRFTSEMMLNSTARTIVESSIALARRLDMKTVAEGIESEDQLHALKDMGCDLAQGYFIGMPMEFDNFLASARQMAPAAT